MGLGKGGQKWGPFHSTNNRLRVISKRRKMKKKFQLSTFSLYWINLKTITLRSLPERAILFCQSGEGGLWICQSRSILFKLDFCRFCLITAASNFYNQASCLITVGWIKAIKVISLSILFCPLTVYTLKNKLRKLAILSACWQR